MRRTVVVSSVIAVLALPATASAYVDRGTDPDDRAPVRYDPDIRATVRKVETGSHGRRLTIVVRAYEELGIWWSIEVRMDARGGRHADTGMRLWNADTGGTGCDVWKRGHRSEPLEGRFRQAGDGARCRVPIRWIDPNKRIRWRLVSETLDPGDGETERAPNAGWYG
jgi:hypothetical protein